MTYIERPSIEEVLATRFVATDGFTITVPEADHAMMHYNEMIVHTYSLPAEAQGDGRLGLMCACMAHALGWTAEEGLQKMRESAGFRGIAVLLQEAYTDCKAQGLYDTPTAHLS